jgi:hypothetical protein
MTQQPEPFYKSPFSKTAIIVGVATVAFLLATAYFQLAIPPDVMAALVFGLAPASVIIVSSSAQRKWEDADRLARGEPPKPPPSKARQTIAYWSAAGFLVLAIAVKAFTSSVPYSPFQFFTAGTLILTVLVFAHHLRRSYRETMPYIGAAAGIFLSYFYLVNTVDDSPFNGPFLPRLAILFLPALGLLILSGIWYNLPHVQRMFDRKEEEERDAERKRLKEEQERKAREIDAQYPAISNTPFTGDITETAKRIAEEIRNKRAL